MPSCRESSRNSTKVSNTKASLACFVGVVVSSCYSLHSCSSLRLGAATTSCTACLLARVDPEVAFFASYCIQKNTHKVFLDLMNAIINSLTLLYYLFISSYYIYF